MLACLLPWSAVWAGTGWPDQPMRGVTISCQTYGIEWARDGFSDELDDLATLGANWVSIHPYGRIHNDGRVSFSYDVDNPPAYLTRPIREAHKRGFRIMVKPHLSYWGSRFSWRGEIAFEGAQDRARFQDSYRDWILTLAEITSDADAFVVGTELDQLLQPDGMWRSLIEGVRTRTDALLGYAANWDRLERVLFWDLLDFIGVQAYFPISDKSDPSIDDLRLGWVRIANRLKAVSRAWDRPVVLTELGYNTALNASSEPWSYHQTWGSDRQRAEQLQARCLQAALETIEGEGDWLKGCFLWKWFVGEHRHGNFILDSNHMRRVMRDRWTAHP